MKTLLRYFSILLCYCILSSTGALAKQKYDIPTSESIADSYVTTQQFAEAENEYIAILSNKSIDLLTYDRVNIKLASVLHTTRKYAEAEKRFGAVMVRNMSAFTPKYACDYVNTLIRLEKLQRATEVANQFSKEATEYHNYKPLQNLLEGLKQNSKITALTAASVKKAPFNMPGSNFWCANYEGNVLFIHNSNNETAMLRGAELYLYNGKNSKPYAKTPRTMQTGPACFSSDGKTMVYTDNRYRENQMVRIQKEEPVVTNYLDIVELSYNEKTQQWENPKSIFTNKPFSSICHPTLSDDGNKLYFAADFTNGKGGMDLYMSKKTKKGWSEPVNLGIAINSQDDELYPSIHGNTLYFSSDGHSGLGGMDLYSVQLNEEGMPIVGTFDHLPYPINTIYNDYALMHKPNNEGGYFTSDRPNGQNLDAIYSWASYAEFAKQEHLIQNASVTAKSAAFTTYSESTENERLIAGSVAEAKSF